MLIGRDTDLHRLRDTIAAEGVVALVGPAGVGKTRLLEELASHWPDEVVWCDLEGLTSLDAVQQRLAERLGLETPEALGESLRGAADRLVVLDHAEGAMDAIPGLKHLTCGVVGSRIRPTGTVVQLVPLTDSDAAKLYIDRAQRWVPDWTPDEAALLSLVRVLDGLPLAIELAAAQVRVLPPTPMAARLKAGESLLRQALELSWNRLDPASQAALSSLAQIQGDFDLPTFEAVTGRNASVLEALLDASMVQLVEPGRMRLLHAVRRFARQGDSLDDRYLDWLVSSAQTALRSTDGKALTRLAPDLDRAASDPRAALVRAEIRAEWGPFADPGPSPSPALAQRWGLARAAVLGRAGRHTDALSVLADLEDSLARDTLRVLQWVHIEPSLALDALPALHRAMEGQTGRWVAEACLATAIALAIDEDEAAAREWLERGRSHLNDLPELEARLLGYLGILLRHESVGVARAHLERSVELQQVLGNRRRIAMGLSWVAALRLEQGSDPQADALLARAVDLSLRAGDRLLHAEILGLQTDRALETRQFDAVDDYVAAVHQIGVQAPLVGALTLGRQGLAALGRGHPQAAIQLFDRAIEALEPLGRPSLLARHRTFRHAATQDPHEPLDGHAGRILRAVSGSKAQVAADGSWVASEVGVRTDLSGRPVLCRLAAALARAGPGVDVSRANLIAATWPGQKMRDDSADARLHAAVRSLRKTGLPLDTTRLEDALAYRLSPRADVAAANHDD